MQMRRALAVGINSYADLPLEYAANDAEEIAALLVMQEYNFDVDCILNEEATGTKIIEAVRELFSSPAEALVLYFSGHGVVDEEGLYLVPADTGSTSGKMGVAFEIIRNLIIDSSMRDAQIVVILDCCHSGGAVPRSMVQRATRFVEYEDFKIAAHNIGRGKVVLAACEANEYAYERSYIKHGAFTHFLLDGLTGNAVDSSGDVSVHGLYDYVSRSFEAVTGQAPVFIGDVRGRIVLGSGLTPSDQRELSSEKISQIEQQALSELNRYNMFLRDQSFDTLAESSYEDACRMFAPIFGWFERQIDLYPKLNYRPKFKSYHTKAKRELAHLGELDLEYKTRYGTVKEELGTGTFGTVWRLEADDGRNYAYKAYNASDLEIAQKLKRFEHGYHAMNRLNHPNIVKVHQYTECPVGFVMDYIRGPNAGSFVYIESDPVSILRQLHTVGRTLSHAHGRGVIHRDVKPQNIILYNPSGTKDWIPYLTDFDLAWFSTATQMTNEGFGTYRYAAPEQLEAGNSHAARLPTTDVFSFGQLCYFFFFRKDPSFNLEENVHNLHLRIQGWGLEEPVRAFLDLYMGCSQRRPADRIQDFNEICDRLFTIMQLLESRDHQAFIGFDRFCREIAFAIAPLSSSTTVQTSFDTASGMTHVDISAKNERDLFADVTFTFEALVPPVTNSNTYDGMRDAINRRIDNAIKDIYPRIDRHKGNRGPFQTFIEMKGVPITIDGVELARSVVARVADSIEGRGI